MRIALNIKTFKSLCLKAGTKKADEIHDYYLKMEEIIHKVVQEESDELKLQLEQKDNIIMWRGNIYFQCLSFFADGKDTQFNADKWVSTMEEEVEQGCERWRYERI